MPEPVLPPATIVGWRTGLGNAVRRSGNWPTRAAEHPTRNLVMIYLLPSLIPPVALRAPAVWAAYGETGSLGHLAVQCAEPGCTSEWYAPRHERGHSGP